MLDYRFSLPLPPSTNLIYKRANLSSGKKGMYKSQDAVRWRQEALFLLPKVGATLDFPIEVYYSYFFKDERKRDVANYEKLLSDTLVSAKYIKDDSQIQKMTLWKLLDRNNPRVEGLIRPYNAKGTWRENLGGLEEN